MKKSDTSNQTDPRIIFWRQFGAIHLKRRELQTLQSSGSPAFNKPSTLTVVPTHSEPTPLVKASSLTTLHTSNDQIRPLISTANLNSWPQPQIGARPVNQPTPLQAAQLQTTPLQAAQLQTAPLQPTPQHICNVFPQTTSPQTPQSQSPSAGWVTSAHSTPLIRQPAMTSFRSIPQLPFNTGAQTAPQMSSHATTTPIPSVYATGSSTTSPTASWHPPQQQQPQGSQPPPQWQLNKLMAQPPPPPTNWMGPAPIINHNRVMRVAFGGQRKPEATPGVSPVVIRPPNELVRQPNEPVRQAQSEAYQQEIRHLTTPSCSQPNEMAGIWHNSAQRFNSAQMPTVKQHYGTGLISNSYQPPVIVPPQPQFYQQSDLLVQRQPSDLLVQRQVQYSNNIIRPRPPLPYPEKSLVEGGQELFLSQPYVQTGEKHGDNSEERRYIDLSFG